MITIDELKVQLADYAKAVKDLEVFRYTMKMKNMVSD